MDYPGGSRCVEYCDTMWWRIARLGKLLPPLGKRYQAIALPQRGHIPIQLNHSDILGKLEGSLQRIMEICGEARLYSYVR